jgi:hypothetical protein
MVNETKTCNSMKYDDDGERIVMLFGVNIAKENLPKLMTPSRTAIVAWKTSTIVFFRLYLPCGQTPDC